MTKLTIPVELELTPASQELLALLNRLQSSPAALAAEAPQPNTIAGTPPAHGEYWPGQGGRYICTMPSLPGLPLRHLIAGEVSKQKFKYGPRDEVTGADSHADGRANTSALLASGKPHPAAHWASQYTADGHTDFFLPAKLDLVMIHICAKNIAGDHLVWSSTQGSSLSAIVQDFEFGISDWSGKDNEFLVVPVRRIPLHPFSS